MKVRVIGTGAIYTAYNSASTLVNDELVIDMPNGNHKQLLKMGQDIRKIQYICISHLHGDHFADIPFFLKHRLVLKEESSIILIGPKGIKKRLEQLCFVYGFEELEYLQVVTNLTVIELEKEEEIITLEDKYSIKAVQVSHGEAKPAYGYCINDALGITGDSGIDKGVEKILKTTHQMIADCSLIEGDNCHMGVNDIKKLLHENPNKKIIGTHMRDQTREVLKKEKISNFILLEDGEILEI